MPLSSHLAPGFIRLRYTGFTVPHNQIIPIKPAAPMVPGVDPTLETAGGGEVLFSAAIQNYWDVGFKPSFDAATVPGFAEIYAVDPDTGIRTYIYAVIVTGEGSGITANTPLVEGVWVFKTTAGRPLKVYAMEGTYAADVRNIGDVPDDGRQDMVDYILSDDNIFYGRTDAWPLVFMSFTSKENDVLRRRALVTGTL